MTDIASPSFAFCVQSDAYSTSGKIMGRQAAGVGFLQGLARTWPQAVLEGVATGRFDQAELLGTLRGGGFQGDLQLSAVPGLQGARRRGALYYPSIPLRGLARFRNRVAPAACSLFGITHTISTDRAIDGIAGLASPAFKPWDALICTSKAALTVVSAVLDEARDEMRTGAGATRFESVQTPVIPLGVDCRRWTPTADAKAAARVRLGLADDEVAFLFAGRLSFHAKANPAPLYQALQAISGEARIVCIEAGLFVHEGHRDAFAAAQAALAPDVRFVHVPGDDSSAYADAWTAADVFTSLSDNVQETFGLTPVEAMAAGLPVVASDWNGYRDNIRHGVDGFLIPTIAAPPGSGEDLGIAVEASRLSYDRQIGLLSLGVTVDRRALQEALGRLAVDPALRTRMGQAGRARALAVFDWPVVLRAYDELARELAAIRAHGADRAAEPWRERADPFARFESYATRAIADDEPVRLNPQAAGLLATLLELSVASYSFDAAFLPRELPARLVAALRDAGGAATVMGVLAAVGGPSPAARRALAWLFKFGVVEIGGS